MQKELLIFVVLIGIIAALFNVSKTSAELTGNGELQKSDDIIYKAGDHFTLNINAAKTTDTSFGSKGKSKSKTFPFSEKREDYGRDNCDNKY